MSTKIRKKAYRAEPLTLAIILTAPEDKLQSVSTRNRQR